MMAAATQKWKQNAKARIEQLRRRTGLTDKDFGRTINHSRTAVRQWESGLSLPGSEAAIALRAQYGKSLAWWLGDPDASGDDDDAVKHARLRCPNEALAIDEAVCAFLTRQLRLRAAAGDYDSFIPPSASKRDRERAQGSLRRWPARTAFDGSKPLPTLPPTWVPPVLQPALKALEEDIRNRIQRTSDLVTLHERFERTIRLLEEGAERSRVQESIKRLYQFGHQLVDPQSSRGPSLEEDD